MASCPVCGVSHAACGPASTVVPVDTRVSERSQTVGLKRYEVEVGNRRHPYKTTMLLSDEDAVHMGLIKEKAAKAPANKARTAQNKAAKPSGVKPVSAPAADDASDPDASE